MNRQELEDQLTTFEGTSDQRRLVSRQARDLADSGILAEDDDIEVTADFVVDHLRDAPDDHTLLERWNWWVGSLELAYGERYAQFRVRTDLEDSTREER